MLLNFLITLHLAMDLASCKLQTFLHSFTARCCAEHGCAIVCHLPAHFSMMFRYRDHIAWNTSKIISRMISLRCSDLSVEISDSKAHTFLGLWDHWKADEELLLLYESTVIAVPRRFFSDPKMPDLEWSLNMIQCVNFLLPLAPDASASTRLPCLVYINVQLSTYCKIRYVSKFTAALHSSPCDSTAFLLILE